MEQIITIISVIFIVLLPGIVWALVFLPQRIKAAKFKNVLRGYDFKKGYLPNLDETLINNFFLSKDNPDRRITQTFSMEIAGRPAYGGIFTVLNVGYIRARPISSHPFVIIENASPMPLFIIRRKGSIFTQKKLPHAALTGHKTFDKKHTVSFPDESLIQNVLTDGILAFLIEHSHMNVECMGDKVIFYLSDIVNYSQEEVMYAATVLYPLLLKNNASVTS